MARKRQDRLEREIEGALAPGVFVGYRDNGSFVEELEAVQGRIVSLIKEGDAVVAVGLLETFIAGCYEKSEEIDDSDGNFGQLVEGLFCHWIRARQAAKADPDETAGMLLSWMDNDEYGYCRGLEKRAPKVLDRKGLVAFEHAVWDQPSDGDARERHVHLRRIEILKAIHEKRRDVDAYSELCEAEGGVAPQDCQVLAEMCLKRGRLDDALAWVERGLDPERNERWPNRSAWGLRGLQRKLLKRLGRSGEALASAWDDYRRTPSVYSYDDFMEFVPKGERSQWHAKALAALDGASSTSRIELLVKTKEWDRLAQFIEQESRESLMDLSHHTTEPVAKKLAKSHPLLAAKLHIAMALRIVEAGKSKYYGAALGNLEKARKILLAEGRDEDWAALAADIRKKHRRKVGFMPGFERVDTGESMKGPSFRTRTRARWNRGAGGTRLR